MVAFKSSANRVLSAENVNKVFAPFSQPFSMCCFFIKPFESNALWDLQF